MPHEQRDVKLRTVFEDILDADLLLFRDRGVCARFIAAFGRSQYTHVGLASRWDSAGADVGTDAGFDLMSLELTRFGGRAALLASQVHRYPGRIDVFRCLQNGLPLSMQLRAAIARTMRRQCGISYNFAGILRLLLLRVPGLRLLPTVQDQERWFANHRDQQRREHGETWSAKFCSQAVGYSFSLPYGRNYEAIDLVPDLATAFTEPADLARSALLNYQYTLWP